MVKEPDGLPAFMDECALASGGDPRLDAHLQSVRKRVESMFSDPVDAQFGARRIVEELALGLQASLLVRYAPAAVADAFCAGRLGGGDGAGGGRVYGTLPAGIDAKAIVERALPV
jgi:putative acyl-CoA dehydrogenase